jgi:hypothetical protein
MTQLSLARRIPKWYIRIKNVSNYHSNLNCSGNNKQVIIVTIVFSAAAVVPKVKDSCLKFKT